ncbi:ABC transporter ATP-binding protein [Vagococcus luciliae]|uniref:Putative hemin import ATP-binding protein HrtA n=1 Tax=Vagococcus luciliae TaxID=2920380 RepID=A0ABY5NY02_9ENTE|nr:ABC transporter ATP-binding protein [Vagococcus luciliae]UUV98515.1 Putative hemin import ATP-binding protein HrtA [Vagococcus luciliae]
MKTILNMSHITKKFGKGHNEVTALNDLNFQVNEGEFISVIGPSGSGKSTFLTIAGGLQSTTSGNISINDIDFTSLPEKKRAKIRFDEIGFILQTSNLIPFLTIEDQFTLVAKVKKEKVNKDMLDNLLKSLDIDHLRNSYPSDLSGGERQRVAIARSLYNDPSLILADEPTASLDTEHAYNVVKLLVKEAHDKKKATVMVTHDTRMIKWSDRVFQMEDGTLKEIHDF